MHNSRKFNMILACSLAIIFGFVSMHINIVYGQANPFDKVQEKLDGISEEEKKALEHLFVLTQEIEVMELEESKLEKEIQDISLEVIGLETEIKKEEAAYSKKQEGLKQVLQSYQRLGPGSYLEILLDSDSLASFLARLNTLRDLTRNTGELLEQLEASSQKLSAEKSKLSEKLLLAEQKQLQAKEALAKKLKLRREEEDYLSSLKGEREFYQGYLADIRQMWDELKPIFREAAGEFARIIKEGDLPEDSLKVSFSFLSAKGTIPDQAFNKVISEQSKFPGMTFEFQPGKVVVRLPEQKLALTGKFVAREGHILEFQVEEGNFYGMPLEPGSMKELLKEGELTVDLEPLIGRNRLQSVELQQGQLELYVSLSLL